MSFLPKEKQKLILDFILKRIPLDLFLIKFPAKEETIHSLILNMLKESLIRKDPEGVDFGIMLMFRFGIKKDFLELLNTLAEEPWHKKHEDIVSALDELKDPSSVGPLSKTILATYPYLELGDSDSLAKNSIYALKKIGTPEAVQKLGELAQSENAVLRSTATGRLKDLAKKGESDAIRNLAQSYLAP